MEITQKKHRLVELLREGKSLSAAYPIIRWSRSAVRNARLQDPAFDARVKRALEAQDDDEWN